MNRADRQRQTNWMTLLRYTVPFLPFIAYMLVEIHVLPAEIMPAVWVVALVMLLGYMLWRLWQGATKKDERALGHGASGLAMGVVLLLHYCNLIDTTLLVYLTFATVGVQWLVERLFLKVWEH